MSLLDEKDVLDIKHDVSSFLFCNKKNEHQNARENTSDPEEELEVNVNGLENNDIKYVFDPLKIECEVKQEDDDKFLLNKDNIEITDCNYGYNEIIIKTLCEICNSSFHSASEMDTHKCEHRNKDSFKEDMGVSSGKGPYSCEVCNMSFSTEYILSDHNYKHTNTSSFAVEMGDHDESDDQESAIGLQTSSHTRWCQICKESFCKEHDWKDHEHLHVVENPFQCDVCKESFSIKSLLDLHMNYHKFKRKKRYTNANGEKKTPRCEVCKKEFPRVGKLLRHMNVHKDFSCTFCEKIFSRKAWLKKHEIKHTS